jgi:hypothetical protein
MTVGIKRIIYLALGICAGLLTWAVQDLILSFYEGSYLGLSILQGLTSGVLFGFCFGIVEGLAISEKKKALISGFIGMGIGAAGGLLAFLIGGGLLIAITNSFSSELGEVYSLIMPFTRTLGWAFLGIMLGSVEGLRSRSLRRVLIGMLGGLIGGILGGLVLELSLRNFADASFGRMVGFLCMGLFLGFLLGEFERRFSFARLKILSGPLKHKEYILSRKKTRIGKASSCDVYLGAYDNVIDFHASIISDHGTILIEKAKDAKSVVVNEEERAGEEPSSLKYEDVIQIGDVKFLLMAL